MIELKRVLPIKLKMMTDAEGKQRKFPVGGMDTKRMVPYTPGMTNFAIRLSDYPDIVVLDLDIKDHPMKHYSNETYSHETRKGWHCFFKNTFNMTNKRQLQEDNLDLMLGENWLFYNYDDPKVATYKEHNQLEIMDMPQELYDFVKPTLYVRDVATTPETFAPQALLDVLMMKQTGLGHYDKGEWVWKVKNSSDLAFACVCELTKFTDNPEWVGQVIKMIPEIEEKHSTIEYLSTESYSTIPKAKAKIKQRKVSWRTLSDFRVVDLGPKQWFIDIVDNRPVMRNFVEMYMADSGGKTLNIDLLKKFVPVFKGAKFMPDHSEMFVGDYYNTFKGFIEPEAYPEGGGDHLQFLRLCSEGLCNNNTTYFDYLMNYLAHMVQKPAEKPDVAIVLFGKDKGTGKDTFHEVLNKLLVEGGHVAITERMLSSGFNQPLESCLVGVIPETMFGGSHKEDSRMKSLITDDDHTIELKGGATYKVRNYIRLMISSNGMKPVRATDGERRYYPLKPNTAFKRNFEFFKYLKKGGWNVGHLMHYLMNRDISNYEPRDVYHNEFIEELIANNKSVIEDFVEEYWDNCRNDDIYIAKNVYQDFPDKRYTSMRQMTTLIMSTAGDKKHFKKSFNKEYGAHYIIQDHPKGNHEDDIVEGLDTPQIHIEEHDFDAPID